VTGSLSESEVPPDQGQDRRRLKIAAALAVLLCIAVPVGWWWRQHQQVDAALRAIRARGEPVTPAELYAMLPSIAREKDCFLLYQADERTWMRPYRPKLWTLAPFNSDKTLPALGEEWEDAEFAEQFLAEADKDFARWHQAAALGGAANFPIHVEEGYGGLVPWVQPMRGIVRSLILEAYIRARQRNFTASADSLMDAVLIAQSLEHNPLAVSQLVRMSNHRELLRDLKRLLPQADFDPADLARLQAALEVIDFRPGLRLGLMGNRVAGIVSAADPSTMRYGSRIDGRKLTLIHHVTKRQLALGFIDAMNRLIEIADKPWPQVIDETEETKHLPQRAPPRSTFDFDLLPEFLGHLMQYVREGARTTAANQVAILAIALARYHRERGGFPPRLADLSPEYLAEVPLDAMTGKPFVYVLDENGLTLSSSGIDTGAAELNWQARPSAAAKDDLQFRWPATDR
jgi:hypothetical protein